MRNTRRPPSDHLIHEDIDLGDLEAGGLFGDIAHPAHDAADDGGDVEPIGDCDMQVHDQFAVHRFYGDALVQEFLFGERRAQSLDRAAADHPRDAEAFGYCVTDQIGKVLLRDLNDPQMVFQFEHMVMDQEEGKEKWDLAPLPFVKLKKCLEKWQTELYEKGWNSLFWDNHDLPRIVSRWGDDGVYRVPSAKMLAAVLHGMQGTPYIYQGEELGMTNVRFDNIEDYRDIETLNMYYERLDAGFDKEDIMTSVYAKSRDNARTPMQWNIQDNAGFTTGTPWLGINPNYKEINAEKERKDPDSVYQFYRRLIRLRKTYPVLTDGKFELLLPEDGQIFAYTRTDQERELLVCANFTGEPVKCSLPAQWKSAEMLIHNYEGAVEDELRPYETVMLLRKRQGQ